MSQNVPGSPILQSLQAQWNIAMYVARGSPYTRRLCQVRDPAHQVNELAGYQNAWTRAAVSVSMEKDD